jgi:hypothetical protein
MKHRFSSTWLHFPSFRACSRYGGSFSDNDGFLTHVWHVFIIILLYVSLSKKAILRAVGFVVEFYEIK